ncbi:phosphate/phosphite/phosphonate ABC transporter substrate-binding protein [Chitinimonas arctica]|nr:phosphate/phosphite/phosphonate ABC transporter substrate-binding protein [Chitinimonas arctica]
MVRALLLLVLALSAGPLHAAEPKVLRIAANPNLSHLELLQNFGPMASALEKELGVKVELVSGKNYDDTIRLLKAGEVDIAGTGAYGYVSAQAEFGARLVVRYVEEGGDAYRAVLVVRIDSGIVAVRELKGKRIAFTDTKSTSGYALPVLELQRNGIGLKDIQPEFVKSQPNSAIAVFNRQVDAGAIADNQLNEKYGVKLDELKVIWRSEPIPHGIWMAGPAMPADELKRIAAAMLKISASPEARQMFARASVKGFIAGRDSDFDSVRGARQMLEASKEAAVKATGAR